MSKPGPNNRYNSVQEALPTDDQSEWPLDLPKIVLPAATIVLDEVAIRIDHRLPAMKFVFLRKKTWRGGPH